MSNLARKDEEKILSSEFLEEIKRVREEKGISQEEVSEKTNIRLSYIKAIEDGNIDGLPGGIYNRAYIRSVSEFLGINMKPFERKVVSDEFIDEQQIKLEVRPNNLNSQTPHFGILAICFAAILLVYAAFYLIGGDDNTDISSADSSLTPQNESGAASETGTAESDNNAAEVAEGEIDANLNSKTSPLKEQVLSNTGKEFTVSIIAKEQTQVEITDKEDNVVLSKIFLPNEAIIYPADDKEYFLFTPEIGVLEVYLDGVHVEGLPEMEKDGDKFKFTVDALFDAIKPKSPTDPKDEQKENV